MLIFRRHYAYSQALLCPLLSSSSTHFFQYDGITSHKRWRISLYSDQSSTCFRSRRYFRRYFLQSLNRIPPRSKFSGIDQDCPSFGLEHELFLLAPTKRGIAPPYLSPSPEFDHVNPPLAPRPNGVGKCDMPTCHGHPAASHPRFPRQKSSQSRMKSSRLAGSAS